MAASLDTLSQSRLFRSVPADVISLLVAGCPTRTLAEGDLLLSPGEESATLFLVLTGSLAVHLCGLTGSPHGHLGEGECAGELSLLGGRPVSAHVVAAEPTAVLAIPRARVWEIIDAAPEVARNLLNVLAGHLRHDDEVLTEAVRLQGHFERAATVDGLTGLRNRRWLDEAFARQIVRSLRASEPISLLMIDLDDFKMLNDTCGHLVGDAVLCRVAQLIAAHLRSHDLVARYGGDEFVLLLPDTDVEEGCAIADRLRDVVARAHGDAAHEPLPAATVSVGVATARLSNSLGALMTAAAAALYRAKQAGRNAVSR